jgi:hypothetical protein
MQRLAQKPVQENGQEDTNNNLWMKTDKMIRANPVDGNGQEDTSKKCR